MELFTELSDKKKRIFHLKQHKLHSKHAVMIFLKTLRVVLKNMLYKADY